ncbi:unnamed protein product [Ixodes pacificus]
MLSLRQVVLFVTLLVCILAMVAAAPAKICPTYCKKECLNPILCPPQCKDCRLAFFFFGRLREMPEKTSNETFQP